MDNTKSVQFCSVLAVSWPKISGTILAMIFMFLLLDSSQFSMGRALIPLLGLQLLGVTLGSMKIKNFLKPEPKITPSNQMNHVLKHVNFTFVAYAHVLGLLQIIYQSSHASTSIELQEHLQELGPSSTLSTQSRAPLLIVHTRLKGQYLILLNPNTWLLKCQPK